MKQRVLIAENGFCAVQCFNFIFYTKLLNYCYA